MGLLKIARLLRNHTYFTVRREVVDTLFYIFSVYRGMFYQKKEEK